MGELTAEEEIRGPGRADKMNSFGYELLTRLALAEQGARELRTPIYYSLDVWCVIRKILSQLNFCRLYSKIR